MTPEETEQLAACRMRVAELHQALQATRKALLNRSASNREIDPALDMAAAALEASEPEMLDIIGKARAVVEAWKGDSRGMHLDPVNGAIEALEAALPKVGE